MNLFSVAPSSLPNPSRGQTVTSPTFEWLIAPLNSILPSVTPIESGCNRQITFTFEYQLKSLIYYHVETHTSAQSLLQELAHKPEVSQMIGPPEGLGESTFYEANATRGATQMLEVFDKLEKLVSKRLTKRHAQLGELVAIDGSLIEATLSMTWADYRQSSNKAKVHLGFDLTRSIPKKLYLSDGKGAERPFASQILAKGETGVLDRGYQDHERFDRWIQQGKHFVARLKRNTRWQLIDKLPFEPKGKVFFFAKVKLGDKNHQMQNPVYLVGFRVGKKIYWVATSRDDLTAEQIAFIYSLRWEIEKMFGWWKRHLKVYHLISRNRHGMLLQLLAGLITYLLFLLYCSQLNGESQPSIRRLRQLRWQIRQEMADSALVVKVVIHIRFRVQLL